MDRETVVVYVKGETLNDIVKKLNNCVGHDSDNFDRDFDYPKGCVVESVLSVALNGKEALAVLKIKPLTAGEPRARFI